MTAPWNHTVCETCWANENGDRTPCRVIDAEWEPCCFCTAPTQAGIYIRRSSAEMPCRGNHPGLKPDDDL